MRVPIIMPQLGESIAEATIVSIAVKHGERVSADQEIIEVETQKALLQVTAPCGGHLVELLAEAQETYQVGATLGYIEADPVEADASNASPDHTNGSEGALMVDVEPGQSDDWSSWSGPTPAAPVLSSARATGPGNLENPVATTLGSHAGGLPVPAELGGAGYLSPRLKTRLRELGLRAADLSSVAGTGLGGRVTIADLEKYVAVLEERDTLPASAMRVAVADALRRSWTRPLATVGRGVCLDPLFALRKTRPEPKIGMTLSLMRALALALAADPAVASRLVGRRIISPASIDIGFAVETADGLVVPVLRGMEASPAATLLGRFQELAADARQRRLPPGSTGGAVATVTNFGPFGLVWATPIPLPDESIILGLGTGRKVPSWDEASGAFVPVTEAGITLSFDHSSLDGGGAGRLLERVVGYLEAPEQL